MATKVTSVDCAKCGAHLDHVSSDDTFPVAKGEVTFMCSGCFTAIFDELAKGRRCDTCKHVLMSESDRPEYCSLLDTTWPEPDFYCKGWEPE